MTGDFSPSVHEPLTTKEGWRRFVHRCDEPPGLSPVSQLGKGDNDDLRLRYHSRLAIVATPTVSTVTRTGRRLTVLNQHQISAKRGLIITGAAGTGKTTAITEFGKAHELAVYRRHPEDQSRIPVVYVTVPPAATPRMLAVEFARFLGLPVTQRANITDITNAVCGVLVDTRCELVLVDEIHNLNLATRSGAEVSDQLKYFSERLPATFVYAGIDAEHTGLFSGTRGRQIASRFATIATRPFARSTVQQRQEWQALVTTLEQTLRLRKHKPGMLTAMDDYLHDRTGGMIGSLSHLIRGASVDAIITGDEKITKAHLEAVQLDHAAEQHRVSSMTRNGRKRNVSKKAASA
ncbi:TniB family NTP-binding protein [Saccharopolyspora shandongensis]|uniref:TniB family NTP-binding protein n=1 Tax=Saccharopolyspora shandongensis TaxID=418495 RepID=UPI0033CB46F1